MLMFEDANDRFHDAKSLCLVVTKSRLRAGKDDIDIRPCNKSYSEVKRAWKAGKMVTFDPVCFTFKHGETLSDILMHAAIEGVQIDFIECMTDDWRSFKIVDNIRHEVLWCDKEVECEVNAT